jgi:xanthine dehydrogenase YagR molybdenum-binding subunit
MLIVGDAAVLMLSVATGHPGGTLGRYAISIVAADIGTGTWTALAQIAADALDVPSTRSSLGLATRRCRLPPVAVGSAGSATGARRSWRRPTGCATSWTPSTAEPYRSREPRSPRSCPAIPAPRYATHTVGAQFAEV